MTGRCMLQPNTLSDTFSRHLCRNWSAQLPFSRKVLHCTTLSICNCISTSNYSELNVSSQGCGEQRWDRNAQHMFIMDCWSQGSPCAFAKSKCKRGASTDTLANIKHGDTCKCHEQYINFSGVSGRSSWFDAIWKVGDSVCQLIVSWILFLHSMQCLLSSFFLLIWYTALDVHSYT